MAFGLTLVSCASSPGLAAAPPSPRPNRLAVASLAKRGEASSCCIIAGEPLNWVQRSRSIRSRARSASHLYISTRRRPPRRASRNCACRPLTWNSGTAIREVGAKPLSSSARMRPGELIAAKAPWNSRAASAWHTARWVDSTPLGLLVVPEV
ncbi:hypothetical protein D3C78_1196310 [compost metagenome]